MPEQEFPAQMPSPVKTSRAILFVQGGLIILGILITLALLSGNLGSLSALLLISLAWGFLIVGTAIVLGRRQKWVRIVALVVEGLIVLNYSLALFNGGNFVPNVLHLTLALVVIYQLTRPEARAWFAG